MTEIELDTAIADRNGHSKAALASWSRRLWQSSFVLLVLKGLNSALTAVSNFVLTYVLVRTIGLDSYATIASLLAIAALVVQTDLGITGLTFFRLRSHFLTGLDRLGVSEGDRDLVVIIVTIYIAIGVIAVAVLGLAMTANLVQVSSHGVAYLLIFAGAVCALPRMALRVAINARDGFVWTEIVDFGRRVSVLAVTAAMLAGLSFEAYSALNLAVWLSSIAALMWLAGLYGFAPERGALRRGLLLLRREVHGIRATVLLSLADFMISVFPYYLLAGTRDATAVVAFDMFYKVTRFAVLSYLIGAETVLPQQTRAVHAADANALMHATFRGSMVGLLAMISGIVAIAVFGETIFGIILDHHGIVSPLMRLAICAMLAFLLIQTTCQIVLIGAGKFDELARRAGVTLVGMALISALMVQFQWSTDAFIVAYVTVYGFGSLLYAECFYRLVRSLRPHDHDRKGAEVRNIAT